MHDGGGTGSSEPIFTEKEVAELIGTPKPPVSGRGMVWRIVFKSVAVFEGQETNGRKVLARLTDVSERRHSSLDGNEDRTRYYRYRPTAA